MENGSPSTPNYGTSTNQPHHQGSSHIMKPPKPSPSAQAPSNSGHKRSLSGSILAKLPFLRTSFEELPPATETAPGLDGADEDAAPKRGGAMANAMRGAASKTRKRKGSLRKTAILGTGKLRLEGRERRNTLERRPELPDMPLASPTSPESSLKPRPFGYDSPSAASSSDGGWPTGLAVDTTAPPLGSGSAASSLLASPITSPTSNTYASTTDDDDGLTFSRPSTTGPPPPVYFPPSGIQRRRSAQKHLSSPLSQSTLIEEEWDYSETAWWGWVVLIVTWIVFVVGMGSCLGVWSWAWDVGETPYAPPELEDDATLPIVGYYPALIILTAVMAWVWVVIAWVGMKYFRHAKVVGEDD
ncbi:hypothetical protein M501DRAFT_994044 [Patellaria atrata CBS 101060]|uniref:Uncharacterized protein n=1 Tax=Patellaria atrata CBS 101060 TaxID=1346257 RepID=A0A9P4SJW6_9PEZI|nr:hypothetical protein M501DRAFT_994044 [Patellaria atrata CBS 101060]